MIRRQLINFQNRSVDVRVGLGAFDELSRMFASAVGKPKRAMVVWNDATSERFGEVVEHALVFGVQRQGADDDDAKHGGKQQDDSL